MSYGRISKTTQKARQFVGGLDIELCQKNRLVDKIPRMKDIKAKLEKLIADAAECDLIANLATDPAKRETFQRMAREHREMIEGLKADILANK